MKYCYVTTACMSVCVSMCAVMNEEIGCLATRNLGVFDDGIQSEGGARGIVLVVRNRLGGQYSGLGSCVQFNLLI